MSADAALLMGAPQPGGVVIIADHAARHVPPEVALGVDSAVLDTHIAVDIGVAEVAARLVDAVPGCAAVLAAVSRLVIDLNREEDAPGLIPETSDGVAVPGNIGLTADQRAARIDRWHRPYHARIASLMRAHPPAMLLSLHSFTPRLASRPDEQRPWDIGILYADDDRLARIAIPHLMSMGLRVGDQQPYSGKLLNATMNRHGEATGTPYLGVELRQDLVADAEGQARWAEILADTLSRCRNSLA